MLLKCLDKEKFENILVCSQDFHEEDYRDLVDLFEQVEMTRAIGGNDVKAIEECWSEDVKLAERAYQDILKIYNTKVMAEQYSVIYNKFLLNY